MAAADVPRPTLALLRDRTFGPYFVGNLSSNCGAWVHNVAAAVVVFDLTGSATMTGLLSAAQWVFSLVLQPYAGAVTDRVDRRRMLITGQSIAASAALGLTLWSALAGAASPWPVIGATAVIGIGYAISVPSQQALVPSLVPSEDLDSAVALNTVTFNLGRALGPALAAVILLTGGPTVAFAVNAASYLVLIGVLLWIRPREVDRGTPAAVGRRARRDAARAGEATAAGTIAAGSVREGLAHVRRDPTMVLLLLGMAAVGFTADPVTTLTPALAELFGGGETLVGILVGAYGAGAALTATVVGRLRTRFGQERLGAWGLAQFGAGTVLLGVSAGAVMGVAAMLVAGSGFVMAITSLTTRLQRRVPEGLRGRIMALWGVAFLGSRPIAALIDGVVADLSSPRIATALAAAPVLVASVAVARWHQGARAALVPVPEVCER